MDALSDRVFIDVWLETEMGNSESEEIVRKTDRLMFRRSHFLIL